MMTDAEKNKVITDTSLFLYAAMDYVDHLRTVLKSIHSLAKDKDNIERIQELSRLGSYLGDDYHNIVDCERESLEGKCDEL